MEADDPIFNEKKQARAELRNAIKNHYCTEAIEENNKLIDTNFKDPKFFSKLVNSRRKNNQGYTAKIIVDNQEYKGDAQVLSGFFEYHKNNSNPPHLSKSEDNFTYFYATIDVHAISYVVKQRKWKLPTLTFNQVQDLIAKLKCNKSPDIHGFSAKHVKWGGAVATHFLMKYLNLSFQSIQFGVPSQELTGEASLIHKSNKKSLIEPKNFRRITVCALLGQLKQMAVCDLALPIMKPLKPSSQLGFTPGLFVKLANIIVSEKRALALFHNKIVLHQFLDAFAAFDETLHPIILSQMFQGKIEDDIWSYFHQMHKNSTTYVKWQGLLTDNHIIESKGNRQGGKSSADEWKLYNNKMIADLELACTEEDLISGEPTTVVAVADDVAPSATADTAREVVHQMQILLNIVESHGKQLHMKFGVDKCKLLISARPKKLKSVEILLVNEPAWLLSPTNTLVCPSHQGTSLE